MVAGAGFGGGANGWALDVVGFVSVELTASVVAAGDRSACCVDGNKELHAAAAAARRGEEGTSMAGLLTLCFGR